MVGKYEEKVKIGRNFKNNNQEEQEKCIQEDKRKIQ